MVAPVWIGSECTTVAAIACDCGCDFLRRLAVTEVDNEVVKPKLTILCKIITRMKLLFQNYLGDYITVFGGLRIKFHYSYSFLVLLTRIQLQK